RSRSVGRGRRARGETPALPGARSRRESRGRRARRGLGDLGGVDMKSTEHLWAVGYDNDIEAAPAMERALGKLVLDRHFRDAFFRDPVAATRAADIGLPERERDALACIRPGARAAFRRYLEAKWALSLPAPGEAPEPVSGPK